MDNVLLIAAVRNNTFGINEAANPTEIEFATILTINDDCLLHICKFLNLIDVGNLVSTCQRLQEFAWMSVFPKLANSLELKTIVEHETVLHWDSSTVTVDGLRTQLMQFGNFVQHISLTGPAANVLICQQFGHILSLCPNLQTLRVTDFHCKNAVKVLANVSPHLKELHWIDSSGMKDECSVVLQKLYKLEKITVTGNDNHFSAVLFEHCKNLTYLNIQRFDYPFIANHMNTKDLSKIFEQNAHTLCTLKLKNFGYIESDSIFHLIDEKLPQLEKLGISDGISVARPNYSYIELRYINILELHCLFSYININLLIQSLSGSEVIKELTIFDGQFNETTTDAPFSLKNLQKLYWHSLMPSAAFIKMITKSHMPELRYLKFICKADEDNAFDDIVSLIESKKSLTSVCVVGAYDPSALFIKIIKMLKMSFGRPFLRLGIPHKMGDEEVSASQLFINP